MIGKHNYYIIFTDVETCYSAIVFLTGKSYAASAVKTFVHQIEKQYDVKIQPFQHDMGGEYTNDELQDYYESNGIICELTTTYAHESNRISKRYNQTIITMMGTMKIDITSKFLWAEAATTKVCVKSRLLHYRLPHRKPPHEALYGKKPSIKRLQPFGCQCYVPIPEVIQPSGGRLFAGPIGGAHRETKILH